MRHGSGTLSFRDTEMTVQGKKLPCGQRELRFLNLMKVRSHKGTCFLLTMDTI